MSTCSTAGWAVPHADGALKAFNPARSTLPPGPAVGCILAELLGRKPLFPGAPPARPALSWGRGHAAQVFHPPRMLPSRTCLSFLPATGKDFVHQINLICKVIGTPTEEEIGQSRSEKARAYLRSMPYMPKGGAQQAGVCVYVCVHGGGCGGGWGGRADTVGSAAAGGGPQRTANGVILLPNGVLCARAACRFQAVLPESFPSGRGLPRQAPHL